MARYIEIAQGIYRLRGEVAGEGLFSSFLIQEGAIIEPGPARYWSFIEEGLSKIGYDPKRLSLIIPTHIHLDHAGGVGYLARILPWSKVLVHPQGAHHLIDPTRLIASTKLAYGEDYELRYGPILPVPQNQLYVPNDRETISIDGRQMQVIFTPGHAPHHLSLLDIRTQGVFCGEALGSPQDGIDFVSPIAPPPSFDFPLYLESMEKIRALHPKVLYYTHVPTFGREVDKLIDLSRDNSKQVGQVILEGLQAGEDTLQVEQRVRQFIFATTGRRLGISRKSIGGFIMYFQHQGLA